MPKVSVIVPNYNHAQYLSQRIESILNQTYQNFELIILDDFSTDDSLSILEKYKSNLKVTHFILNDINSGSVFKQWDRGISLAQGEYIWIAESDDIASPIFLENLVSKMEADKSLGIAFCQSNKINSLGEVYGDWINHTKENEDNIFLKNFKMEGNKFIERFLVKQNSIPNASGVVFRKNLYFKVGGVNKNLKTIGDWYIWVKILSRSNIYFSHHKFNFFRMHDSSCVAISTKNDKRANIILMHLNMYEALADFFNETNLEISKKFRNKRNIAASKLFFNCISHKNYKIIFDNFFKLKLFYIFFTSCFYMVALKIFIGFFVGKGYRKI